MITFRDFLYLNTSMLQNYLSTVDGYLEQEIDFSEMERGQKDGKVGIYAVEGKITAETARETKAKRTLTPPAQFQKFYEVLQYLRQLLACDRLRSRVNSAQTGDLLEDFC
jgi:hypothetical protein